jgi:putative ABC transport system permease protein
MMLRARIRSCWRTLVHRDRLDRDLDAEFEAFVDEIVARRVAAGQTPDAARRDALVEIGGLQQIKEDIRAGRTGSTLESLAQDLRYAWRGLRRSPGFAAAAILTLALGIGANTAIFSVVNALLVQPLPYRDSSRLVFVWADMTASGYPRAPLSAPELVDLRDRTTRFESFGAIWANTAALTGDGDPEQLRIGLVTTNFFNVIGVDAALGRTFTTDDESDGLPIAILLGAPVWQRRYGGDRSIVGRRILLNGQPVTVVGVMPPAFRLLLPPDAAVPDDMQAWILFNRNFTRGPRGQMFLRVVGRMRSGVTLEEARREIDGVGAAISREFTEYGNGGRAFTTVGLQADGVRELRQPLLALFAGVAILLLIACVNVAGLLVARAAARSRETALRLALGAGRVRLLRQYLVEGLVLTTAGAAAGLLVARVALPSILALRPASLDRLGAAQIDGRVLAFTLAEAIRLDLLPALRQEGRRMAGSLQYRTRAALVVAQIALGVVLLVGSGLLIRSFQRIQALNPGFASESRLTFKVALPGSRYRNRDAFNAFSRRVQEELSALPGVVSIGAISHLPFDNLPNWGGPYLAAPGDDSNAPHTDLRTVTPGLFETIAAPLVDGRFFTEDDGPRRDMVAIVDDLLARRAWPGQSAVGRRVWIDPFSIGHPAVPATIVGVVRHLRLRSLVDPLSEQVFLPERIVNRSPLAFVVRTSIAPEEVTAAVRRTIAALDPQLPVYEVRPLESFVADARAMQRFTSLLAGAFAAAALVLACVGVYGVMAYATARRRYEFGVRLALGAQRQQVVGLVVREGGRLLLAGVAAGVAVGVLAAHALQSQLFGVTPRDPATYGIAAAVVSCAALAASWLPARRAAAADPLDALRSD